MLMVFSFTNFKLVYSFKSLSLQPMQGYGVMYLTMLGPIFCYFEFEVTLKTMNGVA